MKQTEKSKKISLKSWQQSFSALMTQEPTASHLARVGILETNDMPVAKRLEIYRYAYSARLIEALKEDFPRLLKSVGESKFDKWASEFVRTNPSKHFSLNYYGKKFPKFVEKKSKKASKLARLDWEECEVFLLPEKPFEKPPKGAQFQLTPSLRIFDGHLMYRNYEGVQIEKSDAEALQLLNFLKKDLRFTNFLKFVQKKKIETQKLQNYFQYWATKGIIFPLE